MSITYEGVLAGSGGNIFAGITFWVSQRVPQRNHYIDKIQSNGGTVTPKETDASMKIADHMKQDAPSGSFSFQWIDESLRRGSLADRSAHRIGREEKAGRPAASKEATKGTRTPFTKDDDILLCRFVTTQEGNRGGNEIYKDLESQCPRHTWQSWRNRWLKTWSKVDLRDLPGRGTQHDKSEETSGAPNLPGALRESKSPKPRPHVDQRSPTPAAREQSPRQSPRQRQASRSRSHNMSSPQPAGRQKRLRDDDPDAVVPEGPEPKLQRNSQPRSREATPATPKPSPRNARQRQRQSTPHRQPESFGEDTPSQQLRYEAQAPLRSSPPGRPDVGSASRVNSQAPRQSLKERPAASTPARSGRTPRPQASVSPRAQEEEEEEEEEEEAEEEQAEENQELAGYIRFYESLGYTRDVISEALMSTTMVSGELMLVVMNCLRNGQGIPSNYEGIWTHRDDEGLRMIGANIVEGSQPLTPAQQMAQVELDRLVAKHGEEPVRTRLHFLEDLDTL